MEYNILINNLYLNLKLLQYPEFTVLKHQETFEIQSENKV